MQHADWLSLLALTAFATKLVDGPAKNFAFGGVVLTQLLPGLVLAPLGGLLADRLNRRTVMICCDLARAALVLSIPLVGTLWWLFLGNLLVGCCALLWIPAKDAALPNLLRRPEQMEAAGQVGLVLTYGVSVVCGAGLFAAISGIPTVLGLPTTTFGELGLAKVALTVNGLLFLGSALLVAARLPELSRRSATARRPATRRTGLDRAPLRDGPRFLRDSPLVAGLLIGMTGAVAAGGAVVGSAVPYTASLGAGDAAFGLLLGAVFLGAAGGMAGAPRLARRLPRERVFTSAITSAGGALAAVAVTPHPVSAVLAATALGAGAGAAFLTATTIIGSEVDDAVRGRVNGVYQLLVKVVLAAAAALAATLVTLLGPRTVTVWGDAFLVDGTRPVLLGAAAAAVLAGLAARRRLRRAPRPVPTGTGADRAPSIPSRTWPNT